MIFQFASRKNRCMEMQSQAQMSQRLASHLAQHMFLLARWLCWTLYPLSLQLEDTTFTDLQDFLTTVASFCIIIKSLSFTVYI